MPAARVTLTLLVVLVIVAGAVALGHTQAPAALIVVSMLRTTLQVATPLTLGALSGIYCERAGVVNLAIEGMMLLAAFFGFAAAVGIERALGGGEGTVAASLAGGVVVAVLAGALAGLAHAVLCVSARLDQIVAGTVLNIFAIGITGYLSRQWLTGGDLPHAPGVLPVVTLPFAADVPLVGALLSQQPIAWAALALVPLTHLVLFATPWGLRARAVGEQPRAAAAVGIDVVRVRYANVVIGGCCAGLAGAYFTLESVPSFEPLMTSGRGFIALAAMIYGGWSPVGAWAATLMFGAAQALAINAQGFGVPVPSQLVGMLPYLLTMLALAGIVGRTEPPAADGQPYEPSGARP